MTTAETSTTISSISGTNLNTISGSTKPTQHVQKRTIHQFETDKIEVQDGDQPSAPRTALSKVSWSRRSVTSADLNHDAAQLPGHSMPREANKKKTKTTLKQREWENYGFFCVLKASLKMIFPHLDDPFLTLPSANLD